MGKRNQHSKYQYRKNTIGIHIINCDVFVTLLVPGHEDGVPVDTTVVVLEVVLLEVLDDGSTTCIVEEELLVVEG